MFVASWICQTCPVMSGETLLWHQMSSFTWSCTIVGVQLFVVRFANQDWVPVVLKDYNCAAKRDTTKESGQGSSQQQEQNEIFFCEASSSK